MPDTDQIPIDANLLERIKEARERQAQIEAQQRHTANQAQIEHFTFLVDKLFGANARTSLQARVEWRERPALVIPWQGSEQVLVALPKPTGHVGWTLGAVELFEQKYAPDTQTAFDKLLVALAAAA